MLRGQWKISMFCYVVCGKLACRLLRSQKILFVLFLIWRLWWRRAMAQVVNRLLLWRLECNPKPIHMTSVEKEAVLGQIYIRVLGFPLSV